MTYIEVLHIWQFCRHFVFVEDDEEFLKLIISLYDETSNSEKIADKQIPEKFWSCGMLCLKGSWDP